MAIPPKAQQTVVKTFPIFRPGVGQTLPASQPMQTSPSQSTPQTTPHPVTFQGADTASKTVPVPALPSGSSTTITVTIGFPNLPVPTPTTAQRQPTFQTRQGDILLLNPTVSVENNIQFLTIASTKVVGQSKASTGQVINGTQPPGGLAYASFAAVCTVIMFAHQATAAGSITITANANLVVQTQ
jgi:hypothetical protein